MTGNPHFAASVLIATVIVVYWRVVLAAVATLLVASIIYLSGGVSDLGDEEDQAPAPPPISDAAQGVLDGVPGADGPR